MRCLFLLMCMTGGLAHQHTFGSQQKDLESVFVTLSIEDEPVEKVLYVIEQKTEFRFAYDLDQVRNSAMVSIEAKEQSLLSVLEAISSKTQLKFKQINNTIHVSKAAPTTKSKVGPVQLEIVEVTGKVLDDTGAPLPGASVVVEGEPSRGTVTDMDGNYTIDAPEGATLVFSYIGFESKKVVDRKSVV